jgi:hypothetical protein
VGPPPLVPLDSNPDINSATPKGTSESYEVEPERGAFLLRLRSAPLIGGMRCSGSSCRRLGSLGRRVNKQTCGGAETCGVFR